MSKKETVHQIFKYLTSPLRLEIYRGYLFYLQQYISALGTVLRKLFTGAFSFNGSLDVREV